MKININLPDKNAEESWSAEIRMLKNLGQLKLEDILTKKATITEQTLRAKGEIGQSGIEKLIAVNK